MYPVKKYFDIGDEDRKNYNLIVIGTPNSNPVLKEIYGTANALKVNESFPGNGKGILEILPNPWNERKAILLIESFEDEDLQIFWLFKENCMKKVSVDAVITVHAIKSLHRNIKNLNNFYVLVRGRIEHLKGKEHE